MWIGLWAQSWNLAAELQLATFDLELGDFTSRPFQDWDKLLERLLLLFGNPSGVKSVTCLKELHPVALVVQLSVMLLFS